MKLLLITDLHSWSDEEYNITKNITDYDICFLLGDISLIHLIQIREIIHSPIFGINGNHDCDNIEKAGIDNLHGKCVKIDGLSFAGFQGAVRYKKGPYNMYSQEESMEICRDIPKADIFLTHDRAFDSECKNLVHAGLRGILEYIETTQPRLHIHGHVHRNEVRIIGNTKSIAVYKAAIIDTDTGEVNVLYED